MTPKMLEVVRLAIEQLKLNPSVFATSEMKRLNITENDLADAAAEVKRLAK